MVCSTRCNKPMKVKSTLSPARGDGFRAGGRVSGCIAAAGSVSAPVVLMEYVEKSVAALLQLLSLAASK